MCEILVKSMANYTTDDPEIRKGIYQTGDFVLGFEDGHEWGTDELLAPADGGAFFLWRIPNTTFDYFYKWCEQCFHVDDPFVAMYKDDVQPAVQAPPPDEEIVREMIARRRIFVDPASLPVSFNRLLDVGLLELPLDTLYVKDKVMELPTVLLTRGIKERM